MSTDIYIAAIPAVRTRLCERLGIDAALPSEVLFHRIIDRMTDQGFSWSIGARWERHNNDYYREMNLCVFYRRCDGEEQQGRADARGRVQAVIFAAARALGLEEK